VAKVIEQFHRAMNIIFCQKFCLGTSHQTWLQQSYQRSLTTCVGEV